MVSGDYYPDESNIDENSFCLLPNSSIEYRYLLDGQDFIYHLELKSVKSDDRKYPVKKFQILPMNYTVQDGINNLNLFFHPNQRVRLHKPSREEYNVINHVSESLEIKDF
jgi:hypothetical protein